MEKAQVAVIGAGPGGYAAAFRAADLGLNTVLIDLEPAPGGVCLYRGCIPSKALLHAAKLLNESQEAAAIGISFGEPEVDLDKLRVWKEGVVAKLTGGLAGLGKQRKLRYIQGRAVFTGANALEITVEGGAKQGLAFEHAILATGSRPASLPHLKIDSPRLLDSTGALALKRVPKSLLVVGGGYIGLEMATIYAALGTEVAVVEMLPGILPGADRDLANVLARGLAKRLKAVHLETKVVELIEEPGGLRARFAGKGEGEEVFDEVLISVGRKPNSGGLGLENTKVEVDERGFIKTDAQARSADIAIYAIGDVAGQPMLAHKASHEGIVAAEVIAGNNVSFFPKAIPGVVFTDPEVAWCGLTQEEAHQEGRAVTVTRFPWAASGRAITLNRSDGMTKLVIDPETEVVLGVGIVGPNAGDLIAEGVLAIETGANASDLALCIHPHPTLSETLMEAAEMFHGTATHIYRPKRKPAAKAA